jgi:hypothetical protein
VQDVRRLRAWPLIARTQAHRQPGWGSSATASMLARQIFFEQSMASKEL